MPPRQYSGGEVQSSPLRTMKKCVELQVATNPSGSSISASSAPALAAWMQARMQFSLEWELSFWSCSAGPVRRTCTVKSVMPFCDDLRSRNLVFGDDDDGRRPDRDARILVGRALHARALPSGGCGRRRACRWRRRQANSRSASSVARQADIHVDRLGAFVEPVEMLVEKRDPALRSGAVPPIRRRRARSRNRTPRPRPCHAAEASPLTDMRIPALRGSSA